MSVQDLIAKYRTEIASEICKNGFSDLSRFVSMLFEDLIYEKFMEQVNDDVVSKIRASKHLQSNAGAFMRISATVGLQIAGDVIDNGFSTIRGNLRQAIMIAGQDNLLNVDILNGRPMLDPNKE